MIAIHSPCVVWLQRIYESSALQSGLWHTWARALSPEAINGKCLLFVSERPYCGLDGYWACGCSSMCVTRRHYHNLFHSGIACHHMPSHCEICSILCIQVSIFSELNVNHPIPARIKSYHSIKEIIYQRNNGGHCTILCIKNAVA